jgi:two-component system sensor histidine kinase PilS (NtrC family)
MVDEKNKLVWLIFVRLVVVSLFLASLAYFNIRQNEFFLDGMLNGVIRLIIVTYCFSILSLISLYLSARVISVMAYTQIIWEILFVSTLVLITGGINSSYAFFYNLAIINASFLLARREAFYTAALCGIIYGSILDFHYFGKLVRIGLFPLPESFYGPNQIISAIFTNLLAFFLTALLTGYLAERARRSESALKEKVIDYDELERLNSMIVSSIDSGLVTVNSAGNIRVFNRYATELTGVRPHDAYDRPLSDVIPGIDMTAEIVKGERRKEVVFQSGNSGRKILGIKIVPLKDRDGQHIGAIIDLQDHTMIREMELQLIKADRLAAIGELSARIAHEVRNPLASISGSVQLISQSASVPEDDRKLLDIVMRETNRLENLVTEFLQYARPAIPSRSWFPLRVLVEELTTMFTCDEKFVAVTITNLIADEIELFADQDQFRQVIWNLLLNAAEAMRAGGVVTLECNGLNNRDINNEEKRYNLEIIISDSGEGISEKSMGVIFEPFFTTKPTGTGLGLALVYRIIEAHGGRVKVENNERGGACFRLFLPAAGKYADTFHPITDSEAS